jgi:AcrR family transcriptional regulator
VGQAGIQPVKKQQKKQEEKQVARGSKPIGETKKAAPARKAPVRSAKAARAIGRPAGKRRIGKELLIEKTTELLRTVPPEKLSLSMAARHAKVHLTLFKYYFQDRTRLLVDVARTLSKGIGDRVAAIEGDAKTAPERLAIRIDAMVDFFLINPHYHRLMVEIIGDADPLATELINLWMSKTLDIYSSIIDAGVEEGSLKPIDPYFTFLAIMGLCEQFQHASRLFDRQLVPGETAAHAVGRYKAFVREVILEGVGAAATGAVKKKAVRG